MKKTLAILVCLAMLFTVLSVNVFAVETSPSVTIDTSASANFGSTTFKINFNGFNSSLAGYDLKVNVDGLQITDVVATNVKQIGAEKSYKITNGGSSLHIMEVVSDKTKDSYITVYADILNQNGDPATITLGECKFASSGKALINEVDTSSTGSIAVYNKEVPSSEYVTTYTKEIAQPDLESGYFYPYGSVYTKDGDKETLLAKTADGKFVASTAGMIYHKQYEIPANNFGTYAVADDVVNSDEKALIFGNYISVSTGSIEGNTYGTMLIRSTDWTKFKGSTAESNIISTLYAKAKGATGEKIFKNNGALAGVILVKQTKSLWKNDTTMEYGIQVHPLYAYEYVTVAYDDTDPANPSLSEVAFVKDNKEVQ